MWCQSGWARSGPLQNLNQNDQGVKGSPRERSDQRSTCCRTCCGLPLLLMAPMLARAWLLQALALEALEALEQQLAWLLGSCQSQGDPAPPQVPQPSLAAPTTHSP